MSERKSISLTVNGGDLLKGFAWAADKEAKGNVVIFEGMEEHVTRYDDFRINIGLTFNERWFAKWKVD